MKTNLLTKEMIALKGINEKARKEIDFAIKNIMKLNIEESVHRPTLNMVERTLKPVYLDRVGVPMTDAQTEFLYKKCSRDRVQMIIDVLKERYSTINQRKELIKQVEGMRKMNSSTYLKVKMELYPKLMYRAEIDKFFNTCTAIYQMQPASMEQVRQIKGLALIPEVYEGLFARGIDVANHIDHLGNVLPSFDKEIVNRMNNEDASSFIQFFYTYKQIYNGIALSNEQRNNIRRLYAQLGEQDKCSPIHLMYITNRDYDKVVSELQDRIRVNDIAQEQAYLNGQGERRYVANEWTYENMRETNKELVQTKRLISFVHKTWASLGERYQDDEELSALLPYVSIGDRAYGHIKEDSEQNIEKFIKMVRGKIKEGMEMGTLPRTWIVEQHEDIIELFYPSI